MNDYNKKVNTTIAKFMDDDFFESLGLTYPSPMFEKGKLLPETCKFMSSWDWLMPVIHRLWDDPTSPGPMYDETVKKKDKLHEDVRITTAIRHFMLYGSLQQCAWAVADLITWSETLD